jgi:hypothetical protein
MIRSPYEISMLIPGGVLVTDHIHRKTNDGTCSRCRKVVDDGEVPLMFFVGDGEDMLIYCTACVDAPKPEGGE